MKDSAADRPLYHPDAWCALSFEERRTHLADAVHARLGGSPGVTGASLEPGGPDREYDLTIVLETDVGLMRTPLWSHARATIFCDPSVHPANRERFAPGFAVDEAVARLAGRLAVPYALESRGLTVTLAPEKGVERTWTAEHSRFRNRTAVTREDRVRKAGDVDVRDLLAHFYSGPSLRLVAEGGEPLLLPAASEVEGPLVSLCRDCMRWDDGAAENCTHCGGPAEVVIAARPPKR